MSERRPPLVRAAFAPHQDRADLCRGQLRVPRRSPRPLVCANVLQQARRAA